MHGRAVNRWLETSHVLHGRRSLAGRIQIFVQDSKYLIIEDLELAHALHELLQRLQQEQQIREDHPL